MKKVEDLRTKIRELNAKEVLTEMKDISESMLDLAYSAVLHKEKEVAKEVLRLEEQVDSLLYEARISIMLGARNLEDAIKFAGVLQIASAAEKISNAAGDIAKIGMSMDIASYLDVEDFEEAVINVKIKPASVLMNKTLKELQVKTKTGMRISAIKKNSNWIYSPEKWEKLKEGDFIVATGPPEGIPILYKMATGEEYEQKEVPHKRITEKIAELLADMKNLSELMVGLAYSAVMFYNKDIAEKVGDLEEKMNKMKEELEILVMEAAARKSYKIRFTKLRALLHIAISTEKISNAAYEIADVVLRNIELHPVFLASVKEADEIIAEIEVKNANIFGKTLQELEIEKKGMFILAIHGMNGSWLYNPAPELKIKKGDLLIVRGPEEGEKMLRRICCGAS